MFHCFSYFIPSPILFHCKLLHPRVKQVNEKLALEIFKLSQSYLHLSPLRSCRTCTIVNFNQNPSEAKGPKK